MKLAEIAHPKTPSSAPDASQPIFRSFVEPRRADKTDDAAKQTLRFRPHSVTGWNIPRANPSSENIQFEA
jgi:hypothetical protein